MKRLIVALAIGVASCGPIPAYAASDVNVQAISPAAANAIGYAIGQGQAASATKIVNAINSAASGATIVSMPAVRLQNSVPSVTIISLPSVTLNNSVPSVTIVSMPNVTLNNSVPSVTIISLPSVTLNNSVPSVTIVSMPNVTLNNSVPSVTILSMPVPTVAGMTTGVTHPIGGARENAGATVYAEAVYPMGDYLAAVDSATLLVGSSAIAVCGYVSPTFTAHIVFRNNSDTVTVYLGSSGVTADTGIPLYPHEAFTMDATTAAPNLWYAITKSGSADLRWARW